VKNRSNNSHFYQSVHNTIYKKKLLNVFCDLFAHAQKSDLESMKQIELTRHCVRPSVFPAVKINSRIKWKFSGFN